MISAPAFPCAPMEHPPIPGVLVIYALDMIRQPSGPVTVAQMPNFDIEAVRGPCGIWSPIVSTEARS